MEDWMIRSLQNDRVTMEEFIVADLSEEPKRMERLNNLLARYLNEQNIGGTFYARRTGLRVLKSLLVRSFTEEEWIQYLHHSLNENWGDAEEVVKNLPASKRNEILEGCLHGFIKRGSDRRALATAELLGRTLSLVELEAVVDGSIASGWLATGDVPTEAIELMPEPQAIQSLVKIYETLSNGEDRYGVRFSVLKKLALRHSELSLAQPPNYYDLIPTDPDFTE
ncbi:MAG: hypothetical protein Q8R55_05235 [Candidatus Taylorbacteria bacterium]|nr:hypothetical protein [Candidatus Taylorbacteria bacterium]